MSVRILSPSMFLALAALVLLTPALGQRTWIVDPHGGGDHVFLQTAIDAASDGDVIALRPGALPEQSVTIDGKGLTIAGTPGRSARCPRVEVVRLPLGSMAVLRNLSHYTHPQHPPAIWIRDCDGPVRIEGCAVRSNIGVLVERCRHVSISHSFVQAYTYPQAFTGPPMGGALRVEDSLVVVDNSHVYGEDGLPGWSGLTCGNGDAGTAGLVALGNTTVWATRSTFRGGTGGMRGFSVGGNCQDGPDRPGAFVGLGARLIVRNVVMNGGQAGPVTVLPGPIRAFDVTESVASRGTIQVEAIGDPGERVFLLVSLEAGSRFLGDEAGVYQGPAAIPGGRRLLGTIDGLGRLEATVLAPAVIDATTQTWTVQVVFVDAAGGVRFAPATTVLVIGRRARIAAPGAVIRVDASAVPGGSGAAWSDAVATLSEAVERAWPLPGQPVEVWVREGVHHVTYAGGPADDPLELVSGVHVLGGFGGTETSAAERDPRAHRTVLTGDLLGDDGPGFTGRADNSTRLLERVWSQVSEAVVDGFVVRGGEGFSMVVNLGPVRIERCLFTDNRCDPTGRVVTLSAYGSSRLVNSVFRNNSGKSILTNGGYGGSTSIEGCLIHSNDSPGEAIALGGVNHTHMVHCTVAHNRVGSGRTAVRVASMNPTLRGSIIWGNLAGGTGGYASQISFWGFSNTSALRRCLIEGYPTPGDPTGTLVADPLFVDPIGPDGVPGTGDEDLRLRSGSPAVDAGNNSFVPPSLTEDLDGRPRFADDPSTVNTGIGTPPFVDLGPFER